MQHCKIRSLVFLALLVLAACSDDRSDFGSDGGESGGIATRSGGMVGSGGLATGGVVTGGADAAMVDGGEGLPTCPEYPHLPHQGEWVGETVVTESSCEDMPVGSPVPLFEQFTIEVVDLVPPSATMADLELYDTEGNHYRGIVTNDEVRPRGPISEGVAGADLTTQLSLTFKGNCLTGVMLYNSAPRGGGCMARARLYATRPNSMWK